MLYVLCYMLYVICYMLYVISIRYKYKYRTYETRVIYVPVPSV